MTLEGKVDFVLGSKQRFRRRIQCLSKLGILSPVEVGSVGWALQF